MSEIKAYLDQDYTALKSKAKSSGELFVDYKFPANDSSIFKFENVVFEEIYWKRPHEIVQDPQFIVNKIEPSDLNQGAVGNCWLIAAASCVLSSPELTERTIPTNQSFDKSDYAGIFHFKFWVNGEWVDVVIDDFLPVNKSNRLYFCENRVEKNEMFGPLFEKAYAKLNICYEFLIAGYPHDALVDLTGGVNEVYDLNLSRPTADQEKLLDPNILWEILYKTVNYGSLSIGTISTKDGYGPVLPNGLVICLIYSIINEYELIEINGSFDQIREPGSKKPNNNSIKLMRLRSPWADDYRYNGPWSKNSEEWKKVSEEIKNKIDFNFQENGYFFITFDDFVKNFDYLSICHTNINGISNEGNYGDAHWELKMFKGEWKVGETAGGCEDEDTFWINPQHTFGIKNSNLSVVVSLSQEGISKKRFQTYGEFTGVHDAIGFYIYALNPDAQTNAEGKYEKSNVRLFSFTRAFKYQREFSMRFEIPPGDYVVLPCLYKKDHPGNYVLRVYIQSGNQDGQIKSENDNFPSNNVNPIVDDTDMYDKLYYRGKNKQQNKDLSNQAKHNNSRACLTM